MNAKNTFAIITAIVLVLLVCVAEGTAQDGLKFFKKSTDQLQTLPQPIVGTPFERLLSEVGSIPATDFADDVLILGYDQNAPTYCGTEKWRTGKIVVQCDFLDRYELGGDSFQREDYVLGKDVGTGLRVKMTVNYTIVGGAQPVSGNETIDLTLDADQPEKRHLIDITSLIPSQGIDVLSGQVRVTVDITILDEDPLFPFLDEHARLKIWAETENTVEHGASINRLAPDPGYVTGSSTEFAPVNDRLVHFAWGHSNCEPNYPLYEFQLLRLYNTEIELPTSPKTIHTRLDWDDALRLVLPNTELSLTLAEGSGYYIWRVRHITSKEPGGSANPNNWVPETEWTQPPPLNNNILELGDGGISADPIMNGVFYYEQFDDDKNWKFSRSFAENGKFTEQVSYASTLLRMEQVQRRLMSQNQRIVTQSYYDYSGRGAVQTLPVPYLETDGVDAGSNPIYTNALGYVARKDLLANSAGDPWGVSEFDEFPAPQSTDPNTFASPVPASSGAIAEYYSDGGGSNDIEPLNSDAEGYVFSRTTFFADGTNAAQKTASVGQEHRLHDDPNVADHTTRTFYATASDEELVRLFGSEAPQSTSVRKIVNIDPNGTTSIQFVNKSGQVIASGLAPSNEVNPVLEDLDDEDEIWEGAANSSEQEIDLLHRNGEAYEGNWIEPNRNIVGHKIILTSPQKIKFEYSITPEILETDCPDFCAECDFTVHFKVVDLTNNVVKLNDALVHSPESYLLEDNADCDDAVALEYPTGTEFYETEILAAGAYWVEREVVFNTLKSTSYVVYEDGLAVFVEGTPIRHVEYYKQQIAEHVRQQFYGLGSNAGLQDAYTLVELEEEFLTDEAMAQYDTPAEFYEKLNEHFGGTVLEAGCDRIEISNFECGPDGECPEDPNRFVEVLDHVISDQNSLHNLHSTCGYFDFGDRFGMYCSPGDCNGYHPAHPGLGGPIDDFSAEKLVFLIDNMLHAGYECEDLWRCWNNAIEMRGELMRAADDGYKFENDPSVTLDPDPTRDNTPGVDACFSLLDLFLNCTGYQYSVIQTSNNNYENYVNPERQNLHPNNKGTTFAFEQFRAPVNDQGYDDCMAEADALLSELYADPANPTAEELIARNNYAYNCWIKGQGAQPATTRPSDFNFAENCIEICLLRKQEFRDKAIAAFKRENVNFDIVANTVDAELITCLVDAFSDECNDACTDLLPAQNAEMHLIEKLIDDGLSAEDARDEAWRIFKRYEEFTTGPMLLNVRDAVNGCPLGSELLGGEGVSVTPGIWDDVAAVKQPILDQLNIDIELARKELLTNNLDPAAERESLRKKIEPGLYQLFGEHGCTSPYAYENVYQRSYESAADLIIDQMVNLYQMSKLSNHALLLHNDDDGDGTTSLCELKLTVFQTLANECDPFAVILNDYQSVVLENCFPSCLVDLDFPRVATVTLCGDLCPQVSEGCKICLDFIDGGEFEDQDWPYTTHTYTSKSCAQDFLPIIREQIFGTLEKIVQRRVREFELQYNNQCGDLNKMGEVFKIRYDAPMYHFTLYYYDRAGQLIETVPPKGVEYYTGNDRTAPTSHTMTTQYAYNSLGEMLVQSTPDGGKTRFHYNINGQLRVSQDARQAATSQTTDKFSFVNYDDLGRIVKVGEADGYGGVITPDPVTELNFIDENSSNVFNNESQVTETEYGKLVDNQSSLYRYTPADNAPQDIDPPATFVRNRVASVQRKYKDAQNNSISVTTAYSYDPHGNVEWMLNDIPGAAQKFVRYEYDLISGNVLGVFYNERFEDQFSHCYEYVEDNRLIKAFTSRDGEIWDLDAQYEYYLHGPMKRTVLGEDGVQGLDNVYTLQGWLKGMNHPVVNGNPSQTKDPGLDGKDIESRIARDGFGMILNYYQGDYRHASNAFDSDLNSSNSIPLYFGEVAPGVKAELFNGNITSWQVGHMQPSGGTIKHSQYSQTVYDFRYDQLNRLISADYLVMDGSSWPDQNTPNTPVDDDLYDTRYKYDANGNLMELDRSGGNSGVAYDMDQLEYFYENESNRLTRVDEPLGLSGNYSVDIDNQDLNNYSYDASGNLIGDEAEELTIHWDSYGKITSIIDDNGPDLEFRYDGAGNRVWKIKTGYSGVETTETFYIRDASGNVMATYTVKATPSNDPLALEVEYPLYGSSRVGIYNRPKQDFVSAASDHLLKSNLIATPPGPDGYSRDLGRKNYELSDHLGNVRVVISDYKLPTGVDPGDGPFEADALAINNYFPFGMLQPERSWQSEEYRYAFNGMEKDDEVKGEGNSYTTHFRQMDPRLGRWLTIDPKTNHSESPYVMMGNNSILHIDRLGDTTAHYNSDGYFTHYSRLDEQGLTGILDVPRENGRLQALPFEFNDASYGSTETNRLLIIQERLNIVSADQIEKAMELSGAFSNTARIFPATYLLTESLPVSQSQGLGSGKLDHRTYHAKGLVIMGEQTEHEASGARIVSSTGLNLVLGVQSGQPAVAYDDYDFGNFLWGVSFRLIQAWNPGATERDALNAAHVNNMVNGRRQNAGPVDFLDDPADQRAISNGYNYLVPSELQ